MLMLFVLSICHKFKSRGGRVYRFYQSNCLTKEIHCPTNKGVSYTDLVSDLIITIGE
jgi:hypothetical protein